MRESLFPSHCWFEFGHRSEHLVLGMLRRERLRIAALAPVDVATELFCLNDMGRTGHRLPGRLHGFGASTPSRMYAAYRKIAVAARGLPERNMAYKLS